MSTTKTPDISHPKLFVSYSWSNYKHKEWVLRLCTELREKGVDAIFDEWDLKEGHDAKAFMEKMVTDEEIKKVILVIDGQYGEKADKRIGGVGTETQIITTEIYEKVDQNKFVAVIADSEGKENIPAFYKNRIHIDLSDEELYGENFEQLLRWVYDKPRHIKPDIGKKPAFLEEENQITLSTSSVSRRSLEAFKNSRPYAEGTLDEYFELFSNNLDRFRLAPSNGVTDFDQQVLDSIEQFIPSRNELIKVFGVIAQYDKTTTSAPVIHKFFESLIKYTNRPEGVNSHHTWDYDNFKLIVHESFLLCIAIFLKHERFELVEYLLKKRYYFRKGEDDSESKMESFAVFGNRLNSLKHRNTRLDLRRLSLHADTLKNRCTDSGISFNDIMQADFLLYLAGKIQTIKDNNYHAWWPETLVYKAFYGGVFEIFLRSESTEYFNRLARTLDIKEKEDLEPFVEGIKTGKIHTPEWGFGGFDRIEPLVLMNYEHLCSRA